MLTTSQDMISISYIFLYGWLTAVLTQSVSKIRSDKQSETEMTDSYRISNKPAYHSYFTGKDEHSREENMFMQNIINQHKHEIGLKPSNQKIQVLVLVEIESISEISEVNMDITVTMTIRQLWTDYRFDLTGTGIDSVPVSPILAKRIWVPDLFIEGSKRSFIHVTTTDNMAMRIRDKGLIDYKTKVTSTMLCQMSLRWFPLDIDSCIINMQSFGYFNNEIEFNWNQFQKNDEGLFSNYELVETMPKFRIIHVGVGFRQLNETDYTAVDSSQIKTKNQLRIAFEFRRYFVSVFFHSYFPAIMMVILAGLSMWVDVNSVPARIGMGVTTILTISTLIQGMRSVLPKVNYLTALDIYLWVCFFMVFSATCEYSLLNYWMTEHEEELDENVKKQRGGGNRRSSVSENVVQKSDIFEREMERKLRLATSRNYNFNNNNNNSLLRKTSSDITYNFNPQSSFGNKVFRQSLKNVRSPSVFSRIYQLSYTPDMTIKKARNIEKIFRKYYFLVFILFNLVYWILLVNL